MFIHLIRLEELKRHSVTYWRPGRDSSVPTESWLVLAERDSGCSTTVLRVPVPEGAMQPLEADDVLELFLRGNGIAMRPARRLNL